MFTPRSSRRRHSLDTYIRMEVEERTRDVDRARVPSRPAPSAADGREVEEPLVRPEDRSDVLST